MAGKICLIQFVFLLLALAWVSGMPAEEGGECAIGAGVLKQVLNSSLGKQSF